VQGRSRSRTVVLSIVVFLSLGQAGGLAQETPDYDIIKVIVDSYAEMAGALGGLGVEYLEEEDEPLVIDDPANNFEHSTGFSPQYTPGHVDMRQIVWTGILQPTPETMGFFADRRHDGPWCGGRMRFAQNPDLFSMCAPGHDGTGEAFSDGAWVVGVTLADRVPKSPPARLEYVTWTFDPSGPEPFQAFESFPNDPADGMNGAIGAIFRPGEGWQTFALEYRGQEGFQHKETDALAAVYGNQLAMFVPIEEIQSAQRVTYTAFGSNNRTNNYFFPQFSSQNRNGPMAFAFDTLPVANLSVSQPSPSPDGPRVSTEPTGSGALRQFFVIVLVIGGIAIAVGVYVFWTTRERGRAGKPETPGETPGGGVVSTPTAPITHEPPPVEVPVCDWAAYYVPVGGKPVVIRAANGIECCVYKVSLSSHVVELEEVTRMRQDGPTREGEVGRRNFQSASIHPLGVNAYVEASSRSGPEDSLGWMQGLGDLPDRASQTAQSPEPWPGGSTPDASGSARLDEVTTLSATLESNCPGHQNTFDVSGSSDLTIGANQECTNETDGECPVELTASGWAVGEVNGAISYSVAHLAGGDPNEQEAALAGLGDGERTFHAITDLHDHEELDRSDYVGGDDASGSARTEGDAMSIAVRNFVVVDAGSLVPGEVWPSTNRVTASIETSLSHSFDIHADMTRVDCVNAPCCAMPAGEPASFFDVMTPQSGPPVTECTCDPSLTVHLAGGTAEITAGENTLTVTRPGAVLVGQDQAWEPS
jgi:hypothetical protein